MVKKYKLTIGSRAQVMHGTAKMTGGGLTKRQLKYNKRGKIVSRKASKAAKKSKNLIKAGFLTEKGKFGIIKRGGVYNNDYEFKIYANKMGAEFEESNYVMYIIDTKTQKLIPFNDCHKFVNNANENKLNIHNEKFIRLTNNNNNFLGILTCDYMINESLYREYFQKFLKNKKINVLLKNIDGGVITKAEYTEDDYEKLNNGTYTNTEYITKPINIENITRSFKTGGSHYRFGPKGSNSDGNTSEGNTSTATSLGATSLREATSLGATSLREATSLGATSLREATSLGATSLKTETRKKRRRNNSTPNNTPKEPSKHKKTSNKNFFNFNSFTKTIFNTNDYLLNIERFLKQCVYTDWYIKNGISKSIIKRFNELGYLSFNIKRGIMLHGCRYFSIDEGRYYIVLADRRINILFEGKIISRIPTKQLLENLRSQDNIANSKTVNLQLTFEVNIENIDKFMIYWLYIFKRIGYMIFLEKRFRRTKNETERNNTIMSSIQLHILEKLFLTEEVDYVINGVRNIKALNLMKLLLYYCICSFVLNEGEHQLLKWFYMIYIKKIMISNDGELKKVLNRNWLIVFKGYFTQLNDYIKNKYHEYISANEDFMRDILATEDMDSFIITFNSYFESNPIEYGAGPEEYFILEVRCWNRIIRYIKRNRKLITNPSTNYVERRFGNNGKLYTEKEFKNFYNGSVVQWNKSTTFI